jgi:hypothetical protein
MVKFELDCWGFRIQGLGFVADELALKTNKSNKLSTDN